MAEITVQAYQDLRMYIQNNWNSIELRDQNNNQIIRLATDDPRVNWIHETVTEQVIVDRDPLGKPIYGDGEEIIETDTLELQIVIKGEDVTLPKTFAKSVIFNATTDGKVVSEESFDQFTMENAQDELTVTHKLQVPQIV